MYINHKSIVILSSLAKTNNIFIKDLKPENQITVDLMNTKIIDL